MRGYIYRAIGMKISTTCRSPRNLLLPPPCIMSSATGRVMALTGASTGINDDIAEIKARITQMNDRLGRLESKPAPAPTKAADATASAGGSAGFNIAGSGKWNDAALLVSTNGVTLCVVKRTFTWHCFAPSLSAFPLR